MTKGRGEILEKLEFEKFNVSLIKPINLGISAKEAYTKFSEKKSRNESDRENFKNDLEWAVIDDYEELQKIKQLFLNSIMSGSGSTYFMIDENFKELDGYWIKNGLIAIDKGVEIIEN